MKKLLYIFLFLPVFAPAQVQMFFTSDSSAFITSPLDVDSLFYWFDASQGVFDSIGSPISNFQGVGEWKDLSGRGHHVTQTTNGARPQYQATGGPNSRPAIYFDGSNDFLASAAHLWESDDITVFFVMKWFSATRNAAETVSARGKESNNRQFFILGQTASASYRYEYRAFNNGLNADNKFAGLNNGKSTDWRINAWRADGINNATLWNNSVSQTLVVITQGTGDWTVYNSSDGVLSFGAVDVLGTPTAFLQGYISEIIIYSRALTTAEREAIEAYLNQKYQLY